MRRTVSLSSLRDMALQVGTRDASSSIKLFILSRRRFSIWLCASLRDEQRRQITTSNSGKKNSEKSGGETDNYLAFLIRPCWSLRRKNRHSKSGAISERAEYTTGRSLYLPSLSLSGSMSLRKQQNTVRLIQRYVRLPRVRFIFVWAKLKHPWVLSPKGRW